MENLGQFLELLRGSLSLRGAAKKSGLSHVYIRDLEKNKSNSKNYDHIKPSPETLKKLSEAYNYPYEELMKKAGYIEETRTTYRAETKVEIHFDNVFYIELDDEYITCHTAEGVVKNKIDSLTEFSDFLEKLEDKGFIKADRHVFANLNFVKAFDEQNGFLYFDEKRTVYTTISLIKQKKYQKQIQRAVANNTGQQIEVSFSGKEKSASRLFSVE